VLCIIDVKAVLVKLCQKATESAVFVTRCTTYAKWDRGKAPPLSVSVL